jgi:cytoskeletal protein CcmA (bactofilin family)
MSQEMRMAKEDFLKDLKERYERGEISEETYRSIIKRYEGGDAEDKSAQEEPRQEVISIAGSASLSGDLVTGTFRCSGSGSVKGSLKAKEVKVAGSCDFDGPVQAGTFRASGSVTVAGDLKAATVRTSGSANVKGKITAGELNSSGSIRVAHGIQVEREGKISGSLRTGGDLTAQELEIGGSFKVDGEIRAQEVTIELSGNCRARAIKGQEMHVRVERGLLRSRGKLSVDLVEGREIHLESTRAKRVKGRKVTLGPDCHVDVLEAEEADIHETSTVGERVGREED